MKDYKLQELVAKHAIDASDYYECFFGTEMAPTEVRKKCEWKMDASLQDIHDCIEANYVRKV